MPVSGRKYKKEKWQRSKAQRCFAAKQPSEQTQDKTKDLSSPNLGTKGLTFRGTTRIHVLWDMHSCPAIGGQPSVSPRPLRGELSGKVLHPLSAGDGYSLVDNGPAIFPFIG